MSILITGAAGYIGSHVLKQLLETTEEDIIVVDNFSTGHPDTLQELRKIRDFQLYIADLSDEQDTYKLEDYIMYSNIETVYHFAGSLLVQESVSNPLKYYNNNVVSTLNLLGIIERCSIDNLIFSSTAAVYGNGDMNPINPYGNSKKMVEEIIQDYAKTNKDFNYTILRYFNVAGASLDNTIGQISKTSTHLIKIACEVATGKRESIGIYGSDYNTPDGTCIRDYIHVVDLADLHIEVLNYMLKYKENNIFNAGYGKGYSVKEVLDTINNISPIKIIESERRPGDPDELVSDITKLKEKLNWTPKYNELESICKTALKWERKLNKGIKCF